jgi:DNA mismatch endonuclease (patch repair protein)
MSRIRSTGTSPEARLQPWLEKWLPGQLILVNCKQLFGTPDFAIPEQRIAIFVDGCFFHGCPTHYRAPKQNAAYWLPKIKANRKRDRLVNRTLRADGWIVLRIWEHELKGKKPKGRDRIRRRLRYAQTKTMAPAPMRKVAETPAEYDA